MNINFEHFNYCIAKNFGGRKYWRIQLFELFGGENFGKWSPNKIATDIECLVNLREKTFAIGH